MAASLNISMPQDLRDMIDERCSRGGFATPTEYIRQLVREDLAQEQERRLETLLLEGMESGDAGVMDKKAWAELRETARAQAARRKGR
ncbi:MAG: type II toxin-antitoxin system ParD family antitoxin [Deltaproteobacteria bacterium]|nr:type II toxin-antitoxin system ParD family antitoxin [Deltaproteobacteria bacterium]MBW2397620.1 type II toxin-antitoxin system ParD family antitoxin [Deltaproteobacteria bacterium]